MGRRESNQTNKQLMFWLRNKKIIFLILHAYLEPAYCICAKKVSEYDQEIPQSQTADNPMAPKPLINAHADLNGQASLSLHCSGQKVPKSHMLAAFFASIVFHHNYSDSTSPQQIILLFQ